MENIFKGRWWLPDHPEKVISGDLNVSYSQSNELIIDGSLSESKVLQVTGDYEIIIGRLNNGKDVTLVKCKNSGSSSNSESGVVETRFFVKSVLIGEQFNNISEIKFKKYLIEYLYLNQWINISVVESRFPNICIKKLDPIVLLNNSEGATIRILLNSKISHKVFKLEIAQENNILMEFVNGKTVEEFLAYNYKLQNIFSLLLNENIYPLRIKCQVDKIRDGISFPSEIDIYSWLRDKETDSNTERYFPRSNLVYNEIKDNIENIFEKWFKISEDIEPVFNLYFSVIRKPDIYVENKFHSLMQAIETYHRRVVGGREEEQDKYDLKKKTIVDSVDEAYKDWLDKKLTYGNEISLRKRLEYIVNKYGLCFKGIVEFNNILMNKIINTRNYLTHYDKRFKKDEIFSDLKLAFCNELLKMIIEAILLVEIGIKQDDIRQIFYKRERDNMVVKLRELTS